MDDSTPDSNRQELWDGASQPAADNTSARVGPAEMTAGEGRHAHTTGLGNLSSQNELDSSQPPTQPGQAAGGVTGGVNEDAPACRPSAGRAVDGDFFLSNVSASLSYRRRIRERSAQSHTRPSAAKMTDEPPKVPLNTLVAGTLGVEWVRADEQPTPGSTGRMPWDDITIMPSRTQSRTPVPVSTTSTQVTATRRARSEDAADDQMARQAQGGTETDQEDRSMQLMLLHQQRAKRLKTGLDELGGALQICKRRVDRLFSNTECGQPLEANHGKRIQAPRIEVAQAQAYALTSRNTHPISGAPSSGPLDTRQSRGAGLIAVASRNTTGLSALNRDVLDTSSLGESLLTEGLPSRLGAQTAQPALKKIRLLRWTPPANYGYDGVISTDQIPAYNLKDFVYAYCPEYIALSYAWGDESVVSTISVNGESVQVRTNLAQALASIRDSDAVAYLWADAICINQQDDKEKSSLVQHMGEIFANAKLVYAWLGPIEQATQGSLTSDLFVQLSELGALFWKHAGPADSGKLNERSIDLDSILTKGLQTLFSRFIQHSGQPGGFPTEEYASFSARPFWSRIWVLQEVFLAKSLYYLCGNCRLESKTLAGALILLESFQAHLIRSQGPSQEQIRSDSPLGKFAFGFPSFPEMHRLIIYTSIYPLDVVSLRIAMTNFCVKELPRGSRATDPRDMIYGLMGFANDEERSYIRADYSKSVQETYADITRSMIQNGFTDILAWAQPKTKGIDHLPSWVPDYSSTIYESLCSQGQAKPWLPQFTAGGETRYSDDNAPPFDHLTLPVYGQRLDEVLWVGQLWFPRPSAGGPFSSSVDDTQTSLSRSASYEELLLYLQGIKDLVDYAEKIRGRNIRLGRSDGGAGARSLAGAAWRIPCCDQVVLQSRPVRGDASMKRRYEATLASLEACIRGPESELPAESRPYVEALLRWADKRPFLTTTGFVGLGPAGVKRADTVAVLDGFSACYVLRSQGIVGRSEYRVIGEAYVDGVMDGEMAHAAPDTREWFYLV
ncbi:heterokaryon incompatibility protein-domain-containing protein [Nemania sp. FL0031]|nr:heterokaryon incompatibility protein-domain-containing protein [Nemania sp. FL0031]